VCDIVQSIQKIHKFSLFFTTYYYQYHNYQTEEDKKLHISSAV